MTNLRYAPQLLPVMSQDRLSLYAEVSGDSNPIHLDRHCAAEAGFSDTICHGMLAMTDIGELVRKVGDGWALESYSCRFLAPMLVGTQLSISGEITEEMREKHADNKVLAFIAKNQCGDVMIKGRAIFRK